jgi:hypothetical protein
MTDEDISAYVAGLREASGTFEGTFDQAAYEALGASVPELMPVEISTGGEPLPPEIIFMTQLTIRVEGGQSWTLPVDHVELFPGSSRAVVWVRRTDGKFQ